VLRAKSILSDLTKAAVGFTAHWQAQIIEWESKAENAGKVVPSEYVDRFMLGLNAAIRAAAALAPYQDPKFSNIKVAMSPLDASPEPKMIEGKAAKIDITDLNEITRLYHSVVRAA
jgi:hypothetical protein